MKSLMALPESTNDRSTERFQFSAGDERVMLSYQGTVTEDLITSILQYIEARFAHEPGSARVRRKIVSVLVEALQNIFHHGQPDDRKAEFDASQVMVFRREQDYLVVTGNHVEADRAFDLQARIERINAMSKEELNASYRHILETKAKTSHKGSGVGMIDIARRTGNQIEFSMEKVDASYYFCSMQIKIAS